MGGDFTMAVGATQTPYRVLLPARYDPNRRYPLMLFLHGGKQNLTNFPGATRDVAAALSDLAILIYPKSITPYWEEAARQHRQLLLDIKAWSQQQYCVDPNKVIVGGFSSGSWFTSYVACTLPSEFAGGVMASGGLDQHCDPAKKPPMPALVIIGQKDGGQLSGAMRQAEYFRQANGCTSMTEPGKVPPCVDYTGCQPNHPTIYCLHTGEHEWPTSFGARAVVDFLSRL